MLSWMGHSASKAALSKYSALISPMQAEEDDELEESKVRSPYNISDLPDECLACIFQSLGSGDRKRCSMVCKRWLRVEGQSRQRLCLNATADLLPMIPNLFARFDSVTKLTLKCDLRSASVGDEALILISLRFRNLTRLKLRSCRDITDTGMIAFSKNCTSLKKLCCGSCAFGAKGLNAVLDYCSDLEEIAVKRLRGITDGAAAEPIGPGAAAASLRRICLKELYNGQCFGPLISGAKKLRTLKLIRCSGDWDKLLEVIGGRVSGLVEIHLEGVQVSDVGLAAISNCLDLENLHLVKTPECTNAGLASVAERCKLLRKLRVDGWKADRIGDEGLIAVAKFCSNLQELVLIGLDPTGLSLETLASNCRSLERLALCGSDTVGDAEISCIAHKFMALKKLCIKNCPVSNQGLEALAYGCPNLVKVKVKKCKGVTLEGAEMLRASRGSLVVNLDTGEPEILGASASDDVVQDNGIEFPSGVSQMGVSSIASGGTVRSRSLKLKLRFSRAKSLAACTFKRFCGGSSSCRS